MAATPYVTSAEFTAHPTYLDLDDLRSGIADPTAQTAELSNVLLMASAWADRMCNQQLSAHQVNLNTRARVDRDGNLVVALTDTPYLSVQSVSYGTDWASMTTLANPVVRIEKRRTMLVPVGSSAAPVGMWLYADVLYTAGRPSTILTADATAAATSLTVADPTGILPGAQYRLWEPGAEEYVTVAASYVPPVVTDPPTATAIPLAAATTCAHTGGAGWSGMPPEMRLAVTNYAVSQLMRPDTAAEDSYPDTRLASGTRQKDPRQDGSGLVAEAVRLLNPFARRW